MTFGLDGKMILLRLFAENAVARENCESVASQQNYFLDFCSETAAVRRSANLRLGNKITSVIILLFADVCKFANGIETANMWLDNKIILESFCSGNAMVYENCKSVASQQNLS